MAGPKGPANKLNRYINCLEHLDAVPQNPVS